jgi:hypothetical protein
MPKIVVDFQKFEQEQKNKIVEDLEKYKKILIENSMVMELPDLDKEIENIKNFTSNFWKLVNDHKQKQIDEKYFCEDRLLTPESQTRAVEAVFDDSKEEKRFVTDKFGNILLTPAPDFYRYVEFTYSTYKQFEEIRFLGDSFGIPTRYHIGKIQHNLSPTTIKILENLNQLLTGNFLFEIKEGIKKAIKEIDDNCKFPNKKKKKIEPTLNNWKEWGEKYFFPPPRFRTMSKAELLAASELLEDPEADTPPFGTEDNDQSQEFRDVVKEAATTGLFDIEQKSDASPKPLTDEERAIKELCVPTNEQTLEQKLVNLWRKRWEEFYRKHNPYCLLKDVKDCLIPPNFEFCDLFKNIDANSFMSKLSLLKTAGFSQMYDEIIFQIEKDTGAQQIREASREIRILKKLIDEEEELLDYLKTRQIVLDKSISAIIVNLVKIDSKIKSLEESLLNPLLDQSSKTAIQNKINRNRRRRTDLNTKLIREREELSNTPARIRTLNNNLEKNRQKLIELESNFESVIEQSQFNKKQSDLIAGGRNLEAVFFITSKDGKLTGLEYTNLIINSIDTIIPFENLCALLFQISFSLPNFKIPDNLDEVMAAFTSNFKDMFGDLYEKIALTIVDFILSSLMTAIDLLLSSLCNLLDSTLADTISASSGDISLEKLGQNVLQQAENIAQSFISSPAIAQSTTAGVTTPNTSLRTSLQPQQTDGQGGLTIPNTPQISLQGEGLIDLLSTTLQPSPLGEWRLSPDGKTFTTVPSPEVVDFSQLDSFLTSMLQNNIEDINRWSATAIAESFGERQEEAQLEPEIANEQYSLLARLTPELATQELRNVIKASISLLTPTQSISLLTRNADSDTIDIVMSLSENFAPNLSATYPGRDFIPSLLGEIGLAAGAKEFEERANRLRELREESPITQAVVCEKFDNTKQFVRSLISKTIPKSLAREIVDEIDKKKIEQFNNIIDSFSSLQSGVVPSRTQNPAEFYLDTIDKLLQAGLVSPDGETANINSITIQRENVQDPQTGQTTANIEDSQQNQQVELTLQNLTGSLPSSQSRQERETIENILKRESSKLISENSTFNAMFDMVVNSIFTPVKNNFNRDIGSFINTISSIKDGYKYIPAKEEITDYRTGEKVKVINIEYQNNIKSDLIPVIKINSIGLPNPTYIRVAQQFENLSESQKKDLFLNSVNYDENSSSKWSYECVFVPKSIMKISREVEAASGKKTILLNRRIQSEGNGDIQITYGDGYISQQGEYLYISNGFLEDDFIEQFVDLPAAIISTRNEVGNKFIEGFKDLAENIQFSFSSDNTTITLNQKHGKNNNNPFSMMPGLFKIDQETLGNITLENNLKTTKIDESCLKDISEAISSGGSFDTLIDVLPEAQPASEKIKGAIPVWQITQTNSQESTFFELKASGLIFTPYSTYFNFYHDTNIIGEKNQLTTDISQEIVKINNYENQNQEIFGKNRTFRNLFLSKIDKDLNIRNNVNINFSYIQSILTKNATSNLINNVLKTRFLNNFEIEQTQSSDLGEKSESREKKKLIEYLNLVRKPTELERENGLDPNIMDFEELRKSFKNIYELEEDSPMSKKQARGDENYESKTSKTSKHILSLAFIRSCIVDHLLKSIFVYDYFNYRSDIIDSPFLSKDIGNYILQEAERYNFNNQIHRQVIKYYDLMVKNNIIQETETDKINWEEWRKDLSYSQINCSPKLQKIVSLEFKKIVKKLKKLTNCDESGNSNTNLAKNYLSSLRFYDLPSLRNVDYIDPESGQSISEKENLLNFTNQNDIRKEGDVYLERYVKLGQFNRTIEDLNISGVSSSIIRNVDTTFLSNSILTFNEFSNLVKSLYDKGFTADDIFNCEETISDSENLFREPPKFGIRVSFVSSTPTTKTFDGKTLNYTEEHLKKRTYLTNTYFGSNLNIENNLIIAEEETVMSQDIFKVEENNALLNIESTFLNVYLPLLKERMYKNKTFNTFLKYCLSQDDLQIMMVINSFLIHNDQEGRFLFESTKSTIAKMFGALVNNGNAKNIVRSIEEAQEQQKEREDNTGNPLGPAIEAFKFFYRTPIQLMKGLATINDPNIAIADKIVQGAAMAGALSGQKIDIPYKVASLALLPGPFPFTGIPPIPPPLTLYNLLFPVGPMFLSMEHLLKDLPYYQNQDQGNNTGNGIEDSQNPFFCELSPEENENE